MPRSRFLSSSSRSLFPEFVVGVWVVECCGVVDLDIFYGRIQQD